MNDESNARQAVPEDEAPAPQVARVETVEKWAEEKKLLPQFFPPPNFRAPKGAAGPGGVARIAMSGLTGPVPNRNFWKFAAARAGERWPEGKELTEREFDAAIEKHTNHVCR